MILPRPLLLIPILLIHAACVSVGRPPVQPVETVPKPREPVATAEPAPAPAQPETPPVTAPPEERPPAAGVPEKDSPAVLALRSDAEASATRGDYDNAAASLERAIRIQPRNARLWHDLAEIRLKQQQPGLAEELAKKSNAHARGNAALIRANWTLIAEARRLKGDVEGAASAREKGGP